MINFNSIPCKNCITFPICKTTYQQECQNQKETWRFNNPSKRLYDAFGRNVLCKKCSILAKWVDYNDQSTLQKKCDLVYITFRHE